MPDTTCAQSVLGQSRMIDRVVRDQEIPSAPFTCMPGAASASENRAPAKSPSFSESERAPGTKLQRSAMSESPPSLNREKARRAAAEPKRPGERCGAEPARWLPIVDRARCEGKRDCVEVCPYSVFEVRRIDDADYKALGFRSRLKVSVHGRQSAYTPNADSCRACGLCVVACPENAIRLGRVG